MYSSQQLDELTLIFNMQGYLHLRGVIPPALLNRIKTAFDAAAQPQLDAWRVAAPKQREALYVDLPAILDQDPAFIDLVDIPSIFSLPVAVIGADPADANMARLFHPGPTRLRRRFIATWPMCWGSASTKWAFRPLTGGWPRRRRATLSYSGKANPC